MTSPRFQSLDHLPHSSTQKWTLVGSLAPINFHIWSRKKNKGPLLRSSHVNRPKQWVNVYMKICFIHLFLVTSFYVPLTGLELTAVAGGGLELLDFPAPTPLMKRSMHELPQQSCCLHDHRPLNSLASHRSSTPCLMLDSLCTEWPWFPELTGASSHRICSRQIQAQFLVQALSLFCYVIAAFSRSIVFFHHASVKDVCFWRLVGALDGRRCLRST